MLENMNREVNEDPSLDTPSTICGKTWVVLGLWAWAIDVLSGRNRKASMIACLVVISAPLLGFS
jgi:hypothetical protein